MKDIPAGGKWLGTPAVPMRENMEMYVLQTKLPEMRNLLRSLEKRVAELDRCTNQQHGEAA
jgi:hypothetical protein